LKSIAELITHLHLFRQQTFARPDHVDELLFSVIEYESGIVFDECEQLLRKNPLTYLDDHAKEAIKRYLLNRREFMMNSVLSLEHGLDVPVTQWCLFLEDELEMTREPKAIDEPKGTLPTPNNTQLMHRCAVRVLSSYQHTDLNAALLIWLCEHGLFTSIQSLSPSLLSSTIMLGPHQGETVLYHLTSSHPALMNCQYHQSTHKEKQVPQTLFTTLLNDQPEFILKNPQVLTSVTQETLSITSLAHVSTFSTMLSKKGFVECLQANPACLRHLNMNVLSSFLPGTNTTAFHYLAFNNIGQTLLKENPYLLAHVETRVIERIIFDKHDIFRPGWLIFFMITPMHSYFMVNHAQILTRLSEPNWYTNVSKRTFRDDPDFTLLDLLFAPLNTSLGYPNFACWLHELQMTQSNKKASMLEFISHKLSTFNQATIGTMNFLLNTNQGLAILTTYPAFVRAIWERAVKDYPEQVKTHFYIFAKHLDIIRSINKTPSTKHFWDTLTYQALASCAERGPDSHVPALLYLLYAKESNLPAIWLLSRLKKLDARQLHTKHPTTKETLFYLLIMEKKGAQFFIDNPEILAQVDVSDMSTQIETSGRHEKFGLNMRGHTAFSALVHFNEWTLLQHIKDEQLVKIVTLEALAQAARTLSERRDYPEVKALLQSKPAFAAYVLPHMNKAREEMPPTLADLDETEPCESYSFQP
jgi:hypothetical protein